MKRATLKIKGWMDEKALKCAEDKLPTWKPRKTKRPPIQKNFLYGDICDREQHYFTVPVEVTIKRIDRKDL